MIEQNVSLRPYNTFGLDAQAKLMARVNSIQALQEVLADSRLKSEERFILGGGSNILLTRNVDGLVIKNEIDGIEVIDETPSHFLVKSGAGVVWHELVMHCIANNYAGIENLSLIPGNVGAAPMQNIGAYGVELKDVFHSLKAVDMASGSVHSFSSSDCDFGYRESVFKRKLKGQFVITSVTLKLSKNPNVNTSYGAIEQELEAMRISSPTIKEVSQAVINIRQSKLPDPKELGNSGSFFKNPVVPTSKYEELKSQHPNIPGYPAGENTKLAAGWLIEQCGWKGKVVGNTGSHAKQALVLVNYGNATGVEIFELSEQIMQSVYDTFGVQLEREVNVY
ncbi:MAG: UDP-N-acetylmuramate dehydrogenase [Flavobacteriales bacterium]|nr:UDP-N-acetylmuramate dehydrogenase [Flavobacteriales bacterium]MCB9190627.1 UDP-N-acetylmuramate dehydrogenase [Flavobacteriales bacterium]